MDVAKVLADLTQQVGFPIAVAIWLLWRTDKKLQKMTDVLNEISKTMALIERALNGNRD